MSRMVLGVNTWFTQDDHFGVIFFRATVKTETGSEGIHGQVRQSEVGESAKQACVVGNVLISARDELVGIAAGRRRAQVVVYVARKVRGRLAESTFATSVVAVLNSELGI